MQFEYDPDKSASNKLKHGIDFEDGQALWRDERAIEAPAKDAGESRRMAIGQIDGKLWAAIFTMRGDVVRLISVRRARTKEMVRYEGH